MEFQNSEGVMKNKSKVESLLTAMEKLVDGEKEGERRNTQSGTSIMIRVKSMQTTVL